MLHSWRIMVGAVSVPWNKRFQHRAGGIHLLLIVINTFDLSIRCKQVSSPCQKENWNCGKLEQAVACTLANLLSATCKEISHSVSFKFRLWHELTLIVNIHHHDVCITFPGLRHLVFNLSLKPGCKCHLYPQNHGFLYHVLFWTASLV